MQTSLKARIRPLRSSAIVVLLFFVEPALAQLSPVALSSLSSGDMFVLEQSGQISVVRSQDSAPHLIKVVKIPEFYSPTDLAAGLLGSDEKLFVVSYSRVFSRPQWRLERYSAKGDVERLWTGFGPDIYAGVAVDSRRELIYIATARTAEIHRLSFDSPKAKVPEFVAGIHGASGLGPIAVDTIRQRLFAADPLEGTLYVLNLTSGSSSVISTRIGEPRSLVFDESRHTLYVGEVAGRRVWKIYVDSNPPRRVLFASPSTVTEIPSPNALALGPDGTLWVGGLEGERIVGLRQDGRVLRVIR